MQTALMNVRFEGNNGHDAGLTPFPLMTQSGHQPRFGVDFMATLVAPAFRQSNCELRRLVALAWRSITKALGFFGVET